MNPAVRRIFFALAAIVGLIATGTAGYMLIEGMPLIDAAYMTVITITTVGYSEVRRLDTDGRIFTMLLIAIGSRASLRPLAKAFEK
jgi:voltage-gated potassium channel